MTDAIITTFEKFYNDLSDITVDDELVLDDDNRVVVMEIYQMVFRDYNKYLSDSNTISSLYQYELPEGTRVVSLKKEEFNLDLLENEEQKLVRKLYQHNANKMLNLIYSLQIGKKGISNKMINDIDDNMQVIFENIIKSLKECKSMDNIIWDQEIFDESRNLVKLEIIRARFKPSGIKNLGVCKRCNSKELRFTEVQLRRADEPSSFRVECRDCDFRWTIK